MAKGVLVHRVHIVILGAVHDKGQLCSFIGVELLGLVLEVLGPDSHREILPDSRGNFTVAGVSQDLGVGLPPRSSLVSQSICRCVAPDIDFADEATGRLDFSRFSRSSPI